MLINNLIITIIKMNTNNINKNLPLIAWILNPIASCYWKCSELTKNSINKLGLVLLLSSLFCGAILAAAICTFIFDGFLLFIPVWLLSVFYYYVINRLYIFNSISSQPSKWHRIVIGLLLAIFCSTFVALFFFNDDIENIWFSSIEKEIINADSENEKLYRQRFVYLQKIDSINNYISELQEWLFNEPTGPSNSKTVGPGPVWNARYNSFLAEKEDAEQKIAAFQEEIKSHDETIENNRFGIDQQVAVLIIN